jgi:hypothetical protein
MKLAAASAVACLWLLPGCGPEDPGPTLAERLQGHWKCERKSRVGEYERSDLASLEVQPSSIKYSYNILWDCKTFAADSGGAQVPDCRTPKPEDHGGYFEGVYTAVGDSLELMDATDTLEFRDLKAESFNFIINGSVFPMARD